MSLEQLGTNSKEGCIAPGFNREVIQAIGTTERQLLASESGSLILMDSADSITVRLPTPVAGMQFEFLTTITVTASDSHKVITKTIATEFMLGGVGDFNTTQANGGDAFGAIAGDSFVAFTSNGSTTGGLLGQHLKFTAINSTRWVVSGHQVSTGTSATAFATS